MSTSLQTEELFSTPAQRRVAENLAKLARDEELCPAGYLPSERELADMVGVSRPTLRRVLHRLRDAGLLKENGSRKRLVIPETSGTGGGTASSAARLMKDTVVALMAYSPDAAIKHQQPGWSVHVAAGCFQAASAAGRPVMALGAASLTDETIDHLLKDRPAGILLDVGMPPEIVTVARRLADAGVPLVCHEPNDNLQQFDSVISDHQLGARSIAQWLVSRGAHRILCIFNGDPKAKPAWVAWREAGYFQAMEEACLAPIPPLWLPHFDIRQLHLDRHERFLFKMRHMAGCLAPYLTGPDPIDAIMTVTDGAACFVIEACRQFGKTPNRDVAIAGYDNYWQGCWEWKQNLVSSPPIVTVDKHNDRIGEAMVELLLERIEGRSPTEPQCRIIEPELVVVGE